MNFAKASTEYEPFVSSTDIFLPIRRVLVGAKTPFILGVSLLAFFWSEGDLKDKGLMLPTVIAGESVVPPTVPHWPPSTDGNVTNTGGSATSCSAIFWQRVTSDATIEQGLEGAATLPDDASLLPSVEPGVRGGSGARLFFLVLRLWYIVFDAEWTGDVAVGP